MDKAINTYEDKCWRCDGTGFVQVHGYFEPEECGKCIQGYIPTDQGKALLAFLKRHGAMFSDQITGEDAEAAYNMALEQHAWWEDV